MPKGKETNDTSFTKTDNSGTTESQDGDTTRSRLKAEFDAAALSGDTDRITRATHALTQHMYPRTITEEIRTSDEDEFKRRTGLNYTTVKSRLQGDTRPATSQKSREYGSGNENNAPNNSNIEDGDRWTFGPQDEDVKELLQSHSPAEVMAIITLGLMQEDPEPSQGLDEAR
ncbi:hypothetical protein I302_107738 [Kwoniella bestiolae CBS 10118]|uniref:Uncharacterized protein n=1 Tax=Kwoniella bestiolae CBS 10118 TaxID=1296100 RepID=A0A1B9FXQ9_9TREE|nr:hypothetical protein I302_06523 [Kwoniella bestiolae CBS 10118]OCF23540.1 hypothetical protein I302_06523 [Kwoniella bestiolae CBS 10118]